MTVKDDRWKDDLLSMPSIPGDNLLILSGPILAWIQSYPHIWKPSPCKGFINLLHPDNAKLRGTTRG